MKKVIACFIAMSWIGLSPFPFQLHAQETIVSRKDADYVFSLTRANWEKDSKRFFAPGWIVRSTKHETGSGIMGFDPSTGIGLSIQPLYQSDRDPPTMVIIGNYFPIGALPPMTDQLKKEMEATAQTDLGPTYIVRLNYTKMEKMDGIELILTKKSLRTPQQLTCENYYRFDDSQKVALAHGYLEGVQASLDKEIADILVPPANPKHPMWWVLPYGIEANQVAKLRQKLDEHCRSVGKRQENLLDAFLSIAYQKSGWPALGISVDNKRTDPWRNILGGKGTSLRCTTYSESRKKTRQAVIEGYHLGTQALRVALKSSVDNPILWPSQVTPQTVRVEVERRCQREKEARLRDVLWLTTAEMAIKKDEK